jgi:hypothetical protein
MYGALNGLKLLRDWVEKFIRKFGLKTLRTNLGMGDRLHVLLRRGKVQKYADQLLAFMCMVMDLHVPFLVRKITVLCNKVP